MNVYRISYLLDMILVGYILYILVVNVIRESSKISWSALAFLSKVSQRLYTFNRDFEISISINVQVKSRIDTAVKRALIVRTKTLFSNVYYKITRR